MVRHYLKKTQNAYVKRTRLSELEFLLILRGYCWLLTINETVQFIHDYGAKKKIENLHVSRVSVGKYFQLLNIRVSRYVESGRFMGSNYPYGDDDLDDPQQRQIHIESLMSLFHSVLSNRIDTQSFKRIFAHWRKENLYPHFEDYHWHCLELLWKAEQGIKRSEFRGQYNRAAFMCYFIDRNLDQSPKKVSRLAYDFLVSELEKNPL